MARQRTIKALKARRTTPVVRRGSYEARAARRRELTHKALGDPSTWTDEQVAQRNSALSFALGRSEGRSDFDAYNARQQKAVRSLKRRTARHRKVKAAPMKTTGKARRRAWVKVRSYRRRFPH